MTTPRTHAGRVRHNCALIPVPRELRYAISARYPSVQQCADGLCVSVETARSLMRQGGVVSAEILRRTEERMKGA